MATGADGVAQMELSRMANGLAFAARCQGERPLDSLIREFQTAVVEFGFTASVCGAWIAAGGQRTAWFFFLDWPADWQDIYMTREWFAHDVMMTEAARKMRPYLWDEARNGRNLTDAEAEVYVAARRYGWIDRFAVPIHGPAGYQGVVILDSKRRCDLAPTDTVLLQLMALAIHECCRKVGIEDSDEHKVTLTKREIECLKWVAAGKTDWEISQLLGLAAPTVHFHVERAKKKLNTKTRAQAVAFLVLRGLV